MRINTLLGVKSVMLFMVLILAACTDDIGTQQKESDTIGFDVNADVIASGEQRAARSANLVDLNIDTVSFEGLEEPLCFSTFEMDSIVEDKPAGRDTRMAEITTENMKSFSLYMFQKGDGEDWGVARDDIKGLEVKNVAGKWRTNLPWNNEDKVSKMIAYSPFNAKELGMVLNDNPNYNDLRNFTFWQQDAVENQIDLVYAVSEDIAKGNHGLVNLNFKHLMTEVRFYLGDKLPDGFKVTKIEFCDLPKVATYHQDKHQWDGYQMTINSAYDFSKATSEGKDREITNEETRFRFLPHADLSGVTIKLTYTVNGEENPKTKTLKAGKGLSKGWRIGHSVYYTISGGVDIDNTFEVWQGKEKSGVVSKEEQDKIDKGEVDYKQLKDGDIIEKKRIDEIMISSNDWLNVRSGLRLSDLVKERNLPVDYKVTYRKVGDSDEEWLSLKDFKKKHKRWICEALSDKQKPSVVEVDGHLKGEKQLLTLYTNRDWNDRYSEGLRDKEFSNENLAGNDGAETTANCYVVNGWGTFKLPLVYGNALKNGGDNKSAYTKENSRTDYNGKVTDEMPYVMGTDGHPFVDYKGKAIKQPWIKNAQTAELLWQDEPELISEVKLDSDGKYLTFAVDKETVCQGNAVVCVKDAKGEIMWSWHIWVTHNKLGEGDKTVYNHKDDVTQTQYVSKIMPFNLGYCEKDGKQTAVADRSFQMRIQQVIPSGLSDDKTKLWEKLLKDPQELVLTVKQPGGSDGVVTRANSCMYQWGRKDPFPGLLVLDPNKGVIEDKPMYTTHGVYRLKTEQAPEDGWEYNVSLQKPGIFFLSPEGTVVCENGATIKMGSWLKDRYFNLWNNNFDDFGYKFSQREVRKDYWRYKHSAEIVEKNKKDIIYYTKKKTDESEYVNEIDRSWAAAKAAEDEAKTAYEKAKAEANEEGMKQAEKAMKDAENAIKKAEERKDETYQKYKKHLDDGYYDKKINKLQLENANLTQNVSAKLKACEKTINDAAEKYSYLHKVVKTIYDPSPVGYCVPMFDAFTGFAPDGLYSGVEEGQNPDIAKLEDNGYIKYFYCNILDRKGDLIAFPATSYRDGSNGLLATPPKESGWTKLVTYDGYYFTSGVMYPTPSCGEMSFNESEITTLFATFMTNGRCVRAMKEGSERKVNTFTGKIEPIEEKEENGYIHIGQ